LLVLEYACEMVCNRKENAMAIYIVRKTGWLGAGSKIHVQIDGVRRGEVYGSSPMEFPVDKNEAAVKVTQLGIRSKEKIISDGTLLEIHQSLWYRISFPVMISAQFLTVFLFRFYTEFDTSPCPWCSFPWKSVCDTWISPERSFKRNQ